MLLAIITISIRYARHSHGSDLEAGEPRVVALGPSTACRLGQNIGMHHLNDSIALEGERYEEISPTASYSTLRRLQKTVKPSACMADHKVRNVTLSQLGCTHERKCNLVVAKECSGLLLLLTSIGSA